MRYAQVYARFTHQGVTHYQVGFIPAVTIACDPPYEAGRLTSRWIARTTPLPQATNQAAWQRTLGMALLPLLTPEVQAL